ncbi:non-specific lipid transfer protein GPI-anchored 20 [Quercus robur]|uniref:non-specific lipid transfer protein GPI-anchored 20 n=1 Tax=Quercus robur TaxID=38942 RepID=UPI002161426A|nr:non-specific lipid transfer protein GPI-anchored 20 [Quercus robur]
MAFPSFVPMLAMIVVLIIPVYGQINSPCSASMISSFSPCMGFVTNSSANGTSPTAACCNSLKSLTSGGMGCLCLILTGNVPFQIPINRTMAISLPSACNMAGVPVQCKASASPLPAPGPISLAPTPLPEASSPSPKASSVTEPPTSPALAPEADTTPLLTPPSTTSSEAPTATTGSRPVLTPSSAMPSHSLSSSLLLFALGLFVMSYC